MSLDDIHAVLSARDLRTRDQLIAAHFARMEAGLARTQQAVASLRDLLEHGAEAISEVLDVANALQWHRGAGNAPRPGPAGDRPERQARRLESGKPGSPYASNRCFQLWSTRRRTRSGSPR
ncbi:hypothetical protein ABH935_005442 [Catenulispora sp. GAS73]|uniref:hypothetical protein n=1 Tax=Catenulispora sp. GAS73 TaxID=3156269 RepID=UPI00351713F5